MRSLFAFLFKSNHSSPRVLLISLLLGIFCCAQVWAIPPLETVYYEGELNCTCLNDMSPAVPGAKAGDDCVSDKYSIGFDFSFFGTTLTSSSSPKNDFYIYSNGFISLGDVAPDNGGSSVSYTYLFSQNQSSDLAPMPNTNSPNGIIAPFWNDTFFSDFSSKKTIYKTVQPTLGTVGGDGTKKQLIVQWTNAEFFSGAAIKPPLGTFQAILYEDNATCDIRLQYRQLIGKQDKTFGSKATIGIESLDGTKAAQRSHVPNTSVLKNTTLLQDKSLCFKWNSSTSQYDTLWNAPYDPVYIAPNPPPPPIPEIVKPDISCPTENAKFEWKAGSYLNKSDVIVPPATAPDYTIDSYTLIISDNFDFTVTSGSFPKKYTGITTRSYVVPDILTIGTTYYAAVIAKNSTGDTWSEIKECVGAPSLIIGAVGSGNGVVKGVATSTTSPEIINCAYNAGISGTCKTTSPPANITLTAIPSSGSTFSGWSGTGCNSGVVGLSTQNITCTATFTADYTLTVNSTGTGMGQITSSPAGINCSNNTGICSTTGAASSTIILSPVASSGSTFSGWSGDCSSLGVVSLTKDSICTANFTANPLPPPPVTYYGLTVKTDGTGKGIVTGTGSINCVNGTGTCYRSYTDGSISLTATPDADSEFVGWSTGCSASFSITENMTCTATFNLKTFAVTMTKPTNGKVSAPGLDCGTDCSENISPNDTITLTAIPDPGFTFGGWSGDCAGDNPLTLTVDKAKNCQAIFVPIFKLTVSASNGSIKTVGDTKIDCGSDCVEDYAENTAVKLQATPQTGYSFSHWSGDCSGTANPLDITMNAAKTCQAVFTQVQRQLTLNIDNGTVSGAPGLVCPMVTSCNASYPDGNVLTLTVTASTGYTFIGWEGDCTGTVATTTLTMDSDKTCHAKMISTSVPMLVIANPTQGKVTGLNIDCGTICSATYPAPTTVALTATPEAGYTFTGWSGDCTGTANPLNIDVNSAKSCTANFAPTPITLTLTPPTHGKISAPGLDCGTSCSQILPPDTQIPLTATPEPGYIFTGWSGDCVGTENPLTVTLDKAKNCQANFAPINLPILVVTNPTQGTVTGSGIDCGTTCTAAYPGKTTATLTATPSPGYTFTGWSGDCSGTANPITLEVDSGKNCTANFAPVLVPLNLAKPTNGKVSIPGLDCSHGCNTTLPQNTPVTITATPDPGFVFGGWSGDCAGTTNPLTLTMDAAKNCTPIFVPEDKPMIIIANPTQGKVTGDGIDCGSTCTKTFPAPTTMTLTATPEPGYVFTGWSGDCSGIANPLTIEISKAQSCKANFAPVMLPMTLPKPNNGKVSATGLTCDTTTCNGTYPQNSTVTLTATPEPGFVFTGWSGDCSGMENPLTIQIDKAKNCQANFIPVTQPALIIPEPIKGTIMGDGITPCTTACAQIFPQKQTITLTATPDPGYIFTGWTGDCSGMTNPITVEIDKATTCIPTFTPAPLVVKISEPTHGKLSGIGLTCGSGNADCTENYPYGSNITLTATPDEGYVFVGWSGTCSGTVNPITVQAELAAQCIPLFEKVTPVTESPVTESPVFSLIVGDTNTQQGSVASQPQGIDCGQDCYQQYTTVTTVQLTATPTTGFRFQNWTGDCQGEANPFTLEVNATKNCQARFEPLAVEIPPMQPSLLEITLKVGETQQHLIQGGQNPRTVTQLPDSTLIDMLWDSPVNLLTVTGKVVGKTQLIITDALQRTAIVNVTVIPNCRYNMIGLSGKGETLDGGYNCITPQVVDLTPACRINAVGIDKQGKQIFSHSCFTNHVKTRAARPFVPDAYPMTQVLDFSATITVDPRFVGMKAEVLMVAYSALYGRVDAFMRDGDTWVDWDNEPTSLKAAQLIDKLPSQFDVPIYNGNLSDLLGDAEVYVGYRLENGDIYYNGVEPIRFQIGNSASVDPKLNTEKNVHSNEVNAGSYFESITAIPTGLQNNHQIYTNREPLSLVTYLLVDKKHLGQVADILMVAVHQPYANPAVSYQRIGENWVPWDEKIETLQPAQHYDSLPDNLEIPIYMGSLADAPGEFTVYVGYRLGDGSIIFNGLSPHHFAVANALGRDKEGNPTKPTSRFVNSVNYLNMIHSAGRVTARDDIGVYSSIWVDPAHVGEKVDILMVMLRGTGEHYASYQRNLDQWERWDEQQVSLKATIPNVTLEPLMKDLQLFAGLLEPDDYLMYLGYRLSSGEVVYNGGEVIHIKVDE